LAGICGLVAIGAIFLYLT